MKDFIKNNWQILALEFIVITAFAVFFGKFGDIMIDSYREVYIPQQILDGKCIYRDIFVIYPPLGYLINTFLMKIFGIGQNTLYFAGLFSTMAIVFYTYKIADFFLVKFQPFIVCLFLIAGLVLSPNVFNSFFPYSYGILYGTLFILVSIYNTLKKNFPFSYLFYSLAILCKYEFLLLLPLLILYSKKNDFWKNISAFFLPILITWLILIQQGARAEDIRTTLNIINIMGSSKTLYWFYSIMGLTYRIELIPIYLSSLLKFFIPIFWHLYQEVIIWIFPVITLGALLKLKNLNTNEKFFIFASLLISAKVFLALTLQSYGVYFIPFALISLFILTPAKIKKYLTILVMIWSFIIGGLNINSLSNKKTSFNKVIKYVNENSQAKDQILVYPECLSINIMTNRKSDDKFYSLIPLYVETFGEDLIIKRLEKINPKYIIINNYDTSAYFYKEFGIDYAQDILEWIETNYKLQTIIEDSWTFKFYKKISS